MKKTAMLLILATVLLSSCGRSGWNCRNRYCNAPEKSKKEIPSHDKANV